MNARHAIGAIAAVVALTPASAGAQSPDEYPEPARTVVADCHDNWTLEGGYTLDDLRTAREQIRTQPSTNPSGCVWLVDVVIATKPYLADCTDDGQLANVYTFEQLDQAVANFIKAQDEASRTCASQVSAARGALVAPFADPIYDCAADGDLDSNYPAATLEGAITHLPWDLTRARGCRVELKTEIANTASDTVPQVTVARTRLARSRHPLTYRAAKREAQRRGDQTAGRRTEIRNILRTGIRSYYAQAHWTETDPDGCEGCGYDPNTSTFTDTPLERTCFAEIKVKRSTRTGRISSAVDGRSCF